MTYATRKGVHVDRCACAWLIKRHIDPDAQFIFINDSKEAGDARPFDMVGVEWGHHDNKCTFEILLSLHNLDDPVLAQIGEIIHGADIVSDFDATLESPGMDLAFRGLRLVSTSDEECIERGYVLMDALYAAIKGGFRR